jgi:GH35 family endo-1,4-beta-xylanase
MNFRCLLLITLLGLLPWPARGAASGELLLNPGFAVSADNRLADCWHDDSTALPRAPEFAIDAHEPADRPMQRVVLGPLKGGLFRLVQTVAPLAPGLYRTRLRCRASAPVQVELVLRTTAQPWTSDGSVRANLPADEWRELVGYARVPAPPDKLGFVVVVRDPATLWFASASLQAVDEARLTAAEQAQVERDLGPPLPAVDEAKVIAETDARIRANRTAPLTVNVVNAAGRPLAGAVVRVEHLRHLFWFGAGFDWGLLPHSNESTADRRDRQAFLRLFNAATVRIYAEDYEPQPGLYRDEACLQAISWLNARGLRVRGHPLFWNRASPRWLEAAAPSADQVRNWMDRLLVHASSTILPRMDNVDVFNELVGWDQVPSAMTPVLAGGQKIGAIAGYLRRFKGLNPQTGIVVNDNDATPEYYRLLRDLIDAGAPVDAIGLQSHMQNGAWSVTHLWNVLNRLGLLGRPVFFTELSVISGAPRAFNWRPADPPWETTPAGEAAQADTLDRLYRLVYSHPAAAGIIYWDYSDRGAWLGCPVGLLRKDGSPKPVCARLDRLINREWRTRGEFTADAKGRVVVPEAFEGEYRITANGVEQRGEHSARRPLEAVIRVTP